MRYVGALFVTVIVIAAAYYATYWVASRSKRKLGGKHIRVVERFAISRDKELCLVEFNDKVYFIAITNNAIEAIDKIEASDLEVPEPAQTISFIDAMKKAWERRKGGDS